MQCCAPASSLARCRAGAPPKESPFASKPGGGVPAAPQQADTNSSAGALDAFDANAERPPLDEPSSAVKDAADAVIGSVQTPGAAFQRLAKQVRLQEPGPAAAARMLPVLLPAQG